MRVLSNTLALFLTVAVAAFMVLSVPVLTAGATEHCPDGWTSKDESGNDADLVLAAGTVFCVKGGTEATGILVADGTTTLGEYLIEAGIAGGESYFAVYPATTPSPTPSLIGSPSPSPSPPSSSPSPTPSPTPSGSPPIAAQFSVEVCPATDEPIATGQSLIRFRHPLLVLLLLNVRIDGELVTLRAVADAQAADVTVSVGVHDWSISNPADTEVLASGTVNCPECNPVEVTPPPDAAPPSPTLPPIPDTALGR